MLGIENACSERQLSAGAQTINPTNTPYHATDGTASEFRLKGLADTAVRSFFSGTNLTAAQKAEASTGPGVEYRADRRLATARGCRGGAA